jgi:hypothetical protein
VSWFALIQQSGLTRPDRFRVLQATQTRVTPNAIAGCHSHHPRNREINRGTILGRCIETQSRRALRGERVKKSRAIGYSTAIGTPIARAAAISRLS